MKAHLAPVAALLLGFSLLQSASAEDAVSRCEFELSLKDGSKLKACPQDAGLEVHPRLGSPFDLRWDKLKSLDLEKGGQAAIANLNNGDRLTVGIAAQQIKVQSLLGALEVPVNAIRNIDVILLNGGRHNAALGKPVHGQDGASHGKGLAKHLTDGDPTTHAKPPASHFDYRIDLQAGDDASYRIDEVVLNWGYFGDEFKGVPNKSGEGWAAAAWPGEYVTFYAVEYRKAGSDQWELVHQHEGRPVHEDVAGVVVHRQVLDGDDGYSSISKTHLTGLDLHNVAEFRVRAKGGHWIGLFEFQAHGTRE